ncbi:peptidylprolyl isomerase [bacterium]|nr:peptidylprolyl isomerase [bacterium]MBU1651053.1 peptidylprolyl isomerase [bacterium]
MKIIKLFLIGWFCLSGTASVLAQSPEDIVDRVMAVVGDEIILESEVFQNAQAIALQQGSNEMTNAKKFQKLREDVLKEMINQKILLAKAREDSVIVEQREVERELENRLQQIITNVGSEEKLEELYGYSIRRIRRDFRTTVEEGLMVERVKNGYIRDIKVTRSEIEATFKNNPSEFPAMEDAVELAHILRETGSSGMADSRALAKADSIYQLIQNGVSFDSLAVKLSEDPGSAKKFGAIGWTKRGDLLSAYENAAFVLEVDEVSRPIRSQYGYHIIRLNDQREGEIFTSHILIVPKVTESDEEPIIELLEGIRGKLNSGESFDSLAAEYSQDLESADRGGRLGWFSLNEMPEEFRDEIAEINEGEISQPFKTQYGFHIVKLLTRRDARRLTLDQDWEYISQIVLNNKRETAYNNWLAGLKERYYIEIKK